MSSLSKAVNYPHAGFSRAGARMRPRRRFFMDKPGRSVYNNMMLSAY